MRSKTVFPTPPTVVGDLVAKGEAELGVTQLQELMAVAGIEIVGPLPGDLQNNLVFAAVIIGAAMQPDESKTLVNFLRTTVTAAVIKAKEMDPAGP